jgi:hypothetical protein
MIRSTERGDPLREKIHAAIVDDPDAEPTDEAFWKEECVVMRRPSDAMTRSRPPSSAYKLFEQAMTGRKQILCTYNGRLRELCPIILGHSQGQEKALTYQFGGQSEKGLPPGGQWRCLWLSKVRDIRLRDGPWHAGESHNQPQGCVEVVDLDGNPASPYNPRRRL